MIIESHIPGPITHIQVSRYVSQLNPCPISPQPGLKISIFPLHPGRVSIRVPMFAFHLHLGYFQPPSRSTKLHLSSIQAQSQTNPIFKMCISPHSKSAKLHLRSTQPTFQTHTGLRCTSQPHAGPVSPESRFQDTCITSFQVPFDLNPGP